MIQTLIVTTAVGLSAFHFLRGAYLALCDSRGGSCGKCSTSGCPVARKG
ncbi:MAG: hypothetical protein KA743_03275 [Geothrix sp.]|uniref:FeoB-associated Cys-rich membrane protein n=1 Tax=Candidatus Geothrix odensensis TaxID=2954440 RepID=A0A936F3S6_9BACT|nr:hypothetical protein [Holophagaceae bacterium]MBK8573270.1 hypothetical protein [Candidatus Geothrix odensensis]MBK8790736.1 hypothetical protein [Holophagaceae bacterium]MBP7617507.1 hypothetical protein [Geothrix sp.]